MLDSCSWNGICILGSVVAMDWGIAGSIAMIDCVEVGVVVGWGIVDSVMVGVVIGWGIIGVGICVLGSFVAIGWGIVEGIDTEERPVCYFSGVLYILKYLIYFDLILVLNFFLSVFIFSFIYFVWFSSCAVLYKNWVSILPYL